MSDEEFDLLPFDSQPGPPSLAGPVTPRKHRHEWVYTRAFAIVDGKPVTTGQTATCSRCEVVRDDTRYRRGKSSRRLGHDGERRSEKRYGFRKVGEFGGITDLQGKVTKVQQKTTRAAAPLRWKGIFARLDEVADGRMPAILLSFVHAGLPSDDYFIVRGKDWLDWRGRDDAE